MRQKPRKTESSRASEHFGDDRRFRFGNDTPDFSADCLFKVRRWCDLRQALLKAISGDVGRHFGPFIKERARPRALALQSTNDLQGRSSLGCLQRMTNQSR